jgi:hypothetical protein
MEARVAYAPRTASDVLPLERALRKENGNDNPAHNFGSRAWRFSVYEKGGQVSAQLEPGKYRAEWFNPRTGKQTLIAGGAEGKSWTSPVAEDNGDWVLLLQRY